MSGVRSPDGCSFSGPTGARSPSSTMPSPPPPSTMPSPLRNMSALAAAATECVFSGQGRTDREINTSKEKNCSVRLHGDLVVKYRLRAVGGPAISTFLHKEAPRKFDQVFEIFDPDTFFQSYTACRDAIHQMLMQTPLLREFDLAADNWDDFLPHYLAANNVAVSRRLMEEHGGAALRFNLDISLTIWVKITYSEPKALLLACKEAGAAAAPCRFTIECCVCMEELAGKEGAGTVVRLPCSLLAPWVHLAVVLQGDHMPNVSPRYEQVPHRCHQYTKGEISRSWPLIVRCKDSKHLPYMYLMAEMLALQEGWRDLAFESACQVLVTMSELHKEGQIRGYGRSVRLLGSGF